MLTHQLSPVYSTNEAEGPRGRGEGLVCLCKAEGETQDCVVAAVSPVRCINVKIHRTNITLVPDTFATFLLLFPSVLSLWPFFFLLSNTRPGADCVALVLVPFYSSSSSSSTCRCLFSLLTLLLSWVTGANFKKARQTGWSLSLKRTELYTHRETLCRTLGEINWNIESCSTGR